VLNASSNGNGHLGGMGLDAIVKHLPDGNGILIFTGDGKAELPISEEKLATYKFSAFTFINLPGLSDLVMREAVGDPEAAKKLDDIARQLTYAEERFGGRLGAVDNESVLIDFPGTHQ